MKKTILILSLIVACQTAHAEVVARPWLNPNNPNAVTVKPGRNFFGKDVGQGPIKTLPGSITQPASPQIQLPTRTQIGARVTRATDAANKEFKKLGTLNQN